MRYARPQYCTDNGAMIAYAGCRLVAGQQDDAEVCLFHASMEELMPVNAYQYSLQLPLNAILLTYRDGGQWAQRFDLSACYSVVLRGCEVLFRSLDLISIKTPPTQLI